MSSFLELCQDLARESGTISGTNPTAVASQAGRPLKVVEWTAQAWDLIQNSRSDWRWMQKEFTSKPATSGTAKYTAASWSISNHRDWLRDSQVTGYRPHTIYLAATGVSDERPLIEISWQEWRTKYGRGTQTNNYPNEYAISPTGEFCLGPIPDDSYTVNGEFRQSAITMTADADIPGLPVEFHPIIVWRALWLMGEFDEDVVVIAASRAKYSEMLENLNRAQLPVPAVGGGPLA